MPVPPWLVVVVVVVLVPGLELQPQHVWPDNVFHGGAV